MEEEKAAVEAEFNKLLCRLIIAANDLGAIDYAADNRQAYSREEAEIKQHGLQISVSEEYVSLRADNVRLEAENAEMQEAIKVYEKSDIFFRAEVTRLTVERDRMREVTKALVDTWAPDSEPGIDAVYRTWKAAYDALYPNSTKKFGKPDSALESEANND